MRNLLTATLLAMVLTAAAQGQASYTVSGTCPQEMKTVYVIDALRGNVVDSIATRQGTFRTTGLAKTDDFLGIGTPSHFVVFICEGRDELTVNLNDYTLKGSALNERLNSYDRQVDALAATGNEEALVGLMKQIVRDNRDNVIPVLFINNVAMMADYDELKVLLAPENKYMQHPAAAYARRVYENMELNAPGKPFRELEMADTDDRYCKLSDWVGRGQYVLVDFWASWCGPCRQEMPNVVSNYEKYHQAGFEIVGVSFDNRKEAWVHAISQLGMEWPQMSDLKGWQCAAVEAYGINSIPSSILFDPEGRIVATNLRGPALGKKLQEIYGF